MFLSVIQKAINNIGLEVRDIVLKKNKFVHHLKNLYNIIFLEDVNKSVQIDRVMEYKVEYILILFLFLLCHLFPTVWGRLATLVLYLHRALSLPIVNFIFSILSIHLLGLLH